MFDFTTPPMTQAMQVVETLQTAGFAAYFAGGCVRDAFLGRVPKDFDVATDATPDTVREVFGRRRTLAFGASFGVIGVLGEAPTPTEVATFRSDGDYSDGRRPDSVRYGTAEHDALRRDFTINGMFYDPVARRLIDYVNGERDLKRRIVRAIGDPSKRIGEDKLRMLRAVRFASSLGFTLDPLTLEATRQFAPQVTIVSGERIGAEMRRMLGGVGASESLELLTVCELLDHVWPTVGTRIRTDEEYLVNAKRLLDHVVPYSFVVAVACVLARLGGDSKHTLKEISRCWKLSCEEQRAIDEATRHFQTILKADQLLWSAVQPILASRDAEPIVETAAAWANAFSLPKAGLQHCQTRFSWPRDMLDPPPLINGDTLRRLGFRPSPKFRGVLQAIRDSQLDQHIATEAEAIEHAKRLLSDD
jgi:tRNA nucleotidyltransferase/poly(A) polymerase